MKLLVSPKDEEEALEAVTGGADIIEVKNSVEGSLVANFIWIIKRIREIVPREIEVPATMEDVANPQGTPSPATCGAATSCADRVEVRLSDPGSFSGVV